MYSFIRSIGSKKIIKQAFVIILLAISYSIQSNAQEWIKQNPSLSGSNLLSINGNKNSTILASGENGRILKSTDWGQNWSEITAMNGFSPIKKICFSSNNTAWVSYTNFIFKTTNSGLKWDINLYPGPISAICPIDSLNIYLFGELGLVYKTTDCGENWKRVFYEYSISINSGCFADVNIGWMCGPKGMILNTANGGVTWNKQSSGTESNINAIKFSNNKNGFAVGSQGLILHTSDGGLNWIKRQDTASGELVDLYLVDNNTVFAISKEGIILKSVDTGMTWQSTTKSGLGKLNSIYMRDKENGFIVGEGGLILKTSDGGANWIINQKPEASDLMSSCFLDKNTCWMVGRRGTVLFTSDGGNNWNRKSDSLKGDFFSVAFLNKDTGYITGYGQILKSTNAGNDWVICHKDPYGYKYSQIIIGNDSTLYVLLSGNHLLYSNDFGKTWDQKFTGYFNYENSICSYGNFIWAAGQNGIIINSTDKGDKWNLQYSGTNYSLNSIFFIDGNIGWAAGNNGVIVRTNDGGKTWLSVESWMTNDLSQIIFVDKLNGWVVGSSGIIANSTDGGVSWSIVQSGLTDNINTVSFVDKNTGWFGGTGGTIYKYKNNTLLSSKNSVAENGFSLGQNYPNPFNPTTKISFSIKKESFVKLTVYDIKGEVVSQLVHSYFKKGYYETSFSGEDIASGVYIYCLRIIPVDGSDPLVFSKKMLLVK